MPLNANSGLLRTRPRTFGNFTATAVEYDPNVPSGTPGVRVAPTEFMAGKSNTLGSSMAAVDEQVENNSAFANAVHVPTIETNTGVNSFSLNPTLGLNYPFAALGNKASAGAVTATSSGSATTTLAYTTIPVTGSFVKGRPCVVGTGVNSEPTIIHAYSAGSLQVYALKKNATAASGLSVTMPAETTFANSLMAAGTVGLLPLLTVQKVMGGDHAEEFTSTYCESLTFTLGTGTCEVQAGLYSCDPYTDLNAGTSPAMSVYNPSTSDYNAAVRPFVQMNQMVAVYTDIDGTGSQVQAAIGIKSAKITYNNNLIKEQVGGNGSMQAWPSANVTCQVDYTEIDTARYNALYKNAVRLGLGTELHLGYAKNTGTDVSPVWRFFVAEIPFGIYTNSVGNESQNQTSDYANTAMAQVNRGLRQDMLVLHYV